MKTIDDLTERENIYLAYCRVKNKQDSDTYFWNGEVKDFECDLLSSFQEIKDTLGENLQLGKFQSLFKFKDRTDFDIKDVESTAKVIRPLAKYSFKDEVLIQSVFNVLGNIIKNFMPAENFGVRIADSDSKYALEHWQPYYKEYQRKIEDNRDPTSRFNYMYIFDISDFFGSVSQKRLMNKLEKFAVLNNEKGRDFLEIVRLIIEHYNIKNITNDKHTKYFLESKYNENEDGSLGLPQGLQYSQIMSIWYIEEFIPLVLEKIEKEYSISGASIDMFMYVDDGVIFTEEKINKDDLTRILNQTLNEIDDKYGNDVANKRISINTSKVSSHILDEENAERIIDLIDNQVSILRRALNTNESDYESQESLIDYVNELTDKIKSIADEIEESKEYAESTLNRISKRNASKFSSIKKDSSLFDKVYRSYFLVSNESDNEITEEISKILVINLDFFLRSLMYTAPTVRQRYDVINQLTNTILKLEGSSQIFKEKDEKHQVNYAYYYTTLIRIVFEYEWEDCFKTKEEAITWLNIQYGILEEYQMLDLLSSVEVQGWSTLICDDIENNRRKKELQEIKEALLLRRINLPVTIRDEKPENRYEIKLRINSKIISELHKVFGEKEEITFTKLLENSRLDSEDSFEILKDLSEFWENQYKLDGAINPTLLDLDNLIVLFNGDTPMYYFKDEQDRTIYYLSRNIDPQIYKERLSIACKKILKIEEKYEYIEDMPFWIYRVIKYVDPKIEQVFNKWGTFKIEYFFTIIKDINDNFDNYTDFPGGNIEKASSLFASTFRHKTIYIDKLYVIHYTYHSFWKNGSKDLPFYTLHNDSHALKLIENYVRFAPKFHSIQGAKLNKYDEFLLFSACYLHDIAMLKGMSHHEKFDNTSENIELYMRYFQNESLGHEGERASSSDSITNMKISNGLSKLYDIHKDIENLFENFVRNNHSQKAYEIIVKSNYLPLTDMEKKLVAQISVGHGQEKEDVLGVKDKKRYPREIHGIKSSTNSGATVNLRLLKIYLRLLDLSDVGKERVTKAVFDLYYDRMSDITKSHWIKHLSTDGIEIKRTFEEQEGNDLFKKSTITFEMKRNYLPEKSEIITSESDDKLVELYTETKCEETGKTTYKRKNFLGKEIDSQLGIYNLRCKFLDMDINLEEEFRAINEYFGEEKSFELNLVHTLQKESKEIPIGKRNINSSNETGTKLLLRVL